MNLTCVCFEKRFFRLDANEESPQKLEKNRKAAFQRTIV